MGYKYAIQTLLTEKKLLVEKLKYKEDIDTNTEKIGEN